MKEENKLKPHLITVGLGPVTASRTSSCHACNERVKERWRCSVSHVYQFICIPCLEKEFGRKVEVGDQKEFLG